MRSAILFSTALVLFMWMCCCSTDKDNLAFTEAEQMMAISGKASVTKVEVTGDENAYLFNVTIQSPDSGCEQYADWWEVIDLEGNLIYRRILSHSHVNEQPFTRSGGGVAISETAEVYVRAHMNNSGYGSSVQKGSVAEGFTSTELTIDFAEELQGQMPLPDGCAF